MDSTENKLEKLGACIRRLSGIWKMLEKSISEHPPISIKEGGVLIMDITNV